MNVIPEWHLSLLRCGRCRGELKLRGESLSCDHCGFHLYRDGKIWRNPSIANSEVNNPYSNIDYTSRATIPFTTTAREEPQYRTYIQRVVQKWGPLSLVLDLGCGDGRFTQWLLALGVKQVIASDIDSLNLRRLEQHLGKDQHNRTLILQADLFELPLKPQAVQAIFAIGLLNALGSKFEEVCRMLRNFVPAGGLLANSEPTLEGSLLYALVRHDLDEFVEVAQTYTKAVDIEGDKSKRVPVFEDGVVPAMLACSGFQVVETYGISVLPSLVFGGLFRMRQYDQDVKLKLVSLVDLLVQHNIPVYRVLVYVSKCM